MNQELFDQLTKQSESTITAKVICDSVNPDGVRLTTMEWTYPRVIHSEIMTHRKLSRNAASSRAIPLSKMIDRVETNPFFPLHWGKNQKGMQANEELASNDKFVAAANWIAARDEAIFRAQFMEKIGIHKQIGNRLLEPWMWITVVVSATNFENLFALRCHEYAEPHFQNLAYKIRTALDTSIPKKVQWGGWHLPYTGVDDLIGDINGEYLGFAKISAARCGRVSYLTQDGRRDVEKDLELYERLAASIPLHASPLEHPAQALDPKEIRLEESSIQKPYIFDWGNFDPGWLQFRKMHPNENIIKRRLEDQPIMGAK